MAALRSRRYSQICRRRPSGAHPVRAQTLGCTTTAFDVSICSVRKGGHLSSCKIDQRRRRLRRQEGTPTRDGFRLFLAETGRGHQTEVGKAAQYSTKAPTKKAGARSDS